MLGHELGQRIGAHIGGGERFQVLLGPALALGPIRAAHRTVDHRISCLVNATCLHGGNKITGSELRGLITLTKTATEIPKRVTKQNAGEGKVDPSRARGTSRPFGSTKGPEAIAAPVTTIVRRTHSLRGRWPAISIAGPASLSKEGDGSPCVIVCAIGHAMRKPPV